jgi:hypothetical protein
MSTSTHTVVIHTLNNLSGGGAGGSALACNSRERGFDSSSASSSPGQLVFPVIRVRNTVILQEFLYFLLLLLFIFYLNKDIINLITDFFCDSVIILLIFELSQAQYSLIEVPFLIYLHCI